MVEKSGSNEKVMSKEEIKLNPNLMFVWKVEVYSSWKEINFYYYIKWLKSLRSVAQ